MAKQQKKATAPAAKEHLITVKVRSKFDRGDLVKRMTTVLVGKTYTDWQFVATEVK